MSFDVYVERPDSVRSPTDHGWQANYTSNMGAFFAWALQGVESAEPATRSDSRDAIFGSRHKDGLGALDGVSAEVAAAGLRESLARIEKASDAELERYDAPNGWGTHGRATKFLRSILNACERDPEAVVRVSL